MKTFQDSEKKKKDFHINVFNKYLLSTGHQGCSDKHEGHNPHPNGAFILAAINSEKTKPRTQEDQTKQNLKGIPHLVKS